MFITLMHASYHALQINSEAYYTNIKIRGGARYNITDTSIVFVSIVLVFWSYYWF